MRCLRCPFGHGIVLLAVLAAFSCGPSGRKPVFPVHGQILVDGKPVPNAQVMFHPVDGWGPEENRLPYGETDSDGRFVLSTYDTKDGAPAGDYKVTVGWHRDQSERDDSGAPRKGSASPVPPKYGNPETSGLRVRVNQGRNDLEPFLLKTGPRGPVKPSSSPSDNSSSSLPEGRAAPCAPLAPIACLALP